MTDKNWSARERLCLTDASPLQAEAWCGARTKRCRTATGRRTRRPCRCCLQTPASGSRATVACGSRVPAETARTASSARSLAVSTRGKADLEGRGEIHVSDQINCLFSSSSPAAAETVAVTGKSLPASFLSAFNLGRFLLESEARLRPLLSPTQGAPITCLR